MMRRIADWILPRGRVKEAWEDSREREMWDLLWEYGKGAMGLRRSRAGGLLDEGSESIGWRRPRG